MEKRVPYRVYKKTYPTAKTVPGSYDATSKTIIIVMPEAASHLRFAPSEWTASGNNKRLKGHSITVLQWNTGEEANFALEAHETTERDVKYCIICNGYDPTEESRHIYRTIPGFGADARDEAIRQAKELADTGKYVIA